MTWTAPHHRTDFHRDTVLRDVMATANARRDGVLPWEIPGTREIFETPTDLLAALQMRWHTRLSGAIESELTDQPWDLPQAVVHAWRGLTAEMPGVRAVLDAHAEEDAMQRARRKEWILLATASGLTGMGDPAAVGIGQDVEHRARAVTVDRTAPARTHRGAADGWLARLRHALAA